MVLGNNRTFLRQWAARRASRLPSCCNNPETPLHHIVKYLLRGVGGVRGGRGSGECGCWRFWCAGVTFTRAILFYVHN